MQNNLSKKIKECIKEEFEARHSNQEKTIGVGYPCFDENELYSAVDCLLDLRISQGSRTKLFENEFSKYIGTNYGVAANSGSSANLLALSTLIESGDLKLGDEVIVPAATFATVAAPTVFKEPEKPAEAEGAEGEAAAEGAVEGAEAKPAEGEEKAADDKKAKEETKKEDKASSDKK